ncbi:hypothetical protein L210DRAFT_986553 [Boletus edulis BED1]|uniref:Uncharacterized protein n=1 Tax=Boletus edulis BED1 TaxID=1328754 RepID=A0AAD4BEW7_BOLED|nr:hypothetical protein L210DRAFT_986553 [Boletus edulis BED1]
MSIRAANTSTPRPFTTVLTPPLARSNHTACPCCPSVRAPSSCKSKIMRIIRIAKPPPPPSAPPPAPCKITLHRTHRKYRHPTCATVARLRYVGIRVANTRTAPSSTPAYCKTLPRPHLHGALQDCAAFNVLEIPSLPCQRAHPLLPSCNITLHHTTAPSSVASAPGCLQDNAIPRILRPETPPRILQDKRG